MPAGMTGALRKKRAELPDRQVIFAKAEMRLPAHDPQPKDPLPGRAEEIERGEELLDPLRAQQRARRDAA